MLTIWLSQDVMSNLTAKTQLQFWIDMLVDDMIVSGSKTPPVQPPDRQDHRGVEFSTEANSCEEIEVQ